MKLELTLNGRPCVTEAPGHWTVLDLLRDGLNLMGTKYGCGEGVCGTCTVLADGRPIRACLVLAAHVRGRALVTVEGLERDGRLDPLQTGIGPLDRLYETRDGWICIVALSDREIAALEPVLGLEILADLRFA